ncbi:MerR family transcriptional regulator [Marinovum sp.]|uniref:MerR family transcriptional regulator n=1 Tax=Marinovum sp. TaxID=2024839 RepID=UPI002B27A69F|nr:MerR family transcriptional regulator [Marinovum sp.]
MQEKFGVTARTLRYYEFLELLAPLKHKRQRFYTAKDQARMALVRRGRQFGLRLEEIRQWLQIYEEQGQESQLREWLRIAERQVPVLERELEDRRDALTDLVASMKQAEAELTWRKRQSA